MKINSFLTILTLSATLSACSKNNENKPALILNDSFEDSANGWSSGFANYPNNADSLTYHLYSAVTPLPGPLDNKQKAINLSGASQSGQLFMFIKKKVTGLKSNATYNASFEVELASNAPTGQFGLESSPGEGVSLGAGSAVKEPVKELSADKKSFVMNITKVNLSKNSDDMAFIGNIANGTNQYIYKIIQRNGEYKAITNSKGEAWLIIGTNSAYAGLTSIYFTAAKVTFTER
jgi:hypothetical protein